jgi:hypothetical protein
MPITKLFNVGTLNLSIDDLKYDDEIYFFLYKYIESILEADEIFNSIFLLEHDQKLSIHTFSLHLINFHKHTTMKTEEIGRWKRGEGG